MQRETAMTMMTSTGGTGLEQRNQPVWRKFLHAMIEAPTPRAADEITKYLARHRHDLPPQVWIELERRRFGP
jgi:hypothetical protein